MKYFISLLAIFSTSIIHAGVIQKWDFAQGNWNGLDILDQKAKFTGKATAVPEFENLKLSLSGNEFINVPEVTVNELPSTALAVSARVSITKGQKWGSIVGFLQDNGSYERGWSLGYNESKYVFWVSTGGSLIQIQSKRPFRTGQWDDLTGVFDGNEIRLYVNGTLSGQAVVPGKIVYPDQGKFTIGAYQDDNELYPMVGKIETVTVYDTAIEESVIRKAAGLPVSLEFSIRPSIQFLSTKTAKVNWAVNDGSKGFVEFGKTQRLGTILKAESKGDETEAVIPELEPQTVYFYRITHGNGDDQRTSQIFELNTALNFSPPVATKGGPSRRGYAVVIGADPAAIEKLVANTEMSIIAFETDHTKADKARKEHYRKGLYGSRVTVQIVNDYMELPITSCMANVVVCPTRIDDVSLSELKRILIPGNGVAKIQNGSHETIYKRPAIAKSGEWTHQYGDAANSVSSGESLSGAAATGDLKVQWFGSPGADFGLDRNSRMPAPLAVNNRLFHQGMNRLIALNSVNGAFLWNLEIPGFQRLNMPRDASNWCADQNSLFVAINEKAWVLDAETGKRKAALKPISESGKREWGYIARDGDRLIGSTTKPNSEYTEYWSKKMWFDGKAGSYGTAQVCSDSLFAYDSESLKPAWHYRNGLILNPTISISNHKIFFVESRNKIAKTSITSQISADELWQDQYLVALDLEKGEKLWERAIDTEDGTVTYYMQTTPSTILISASNTAYHLYTFNAVDGSPMWNYSNPWPNDHHSGHIQHPVILDGTIYLQPNGYDLLTGKIVTTKVGARSGCPTYIGADKALIYRGDGRRVAMWNRETETVSTWDRLRPSCWLSMIPANGMLLVPEGGGGCSCGGWMETSIGFAPLTLLQTGLEN